MNQMQARLLVAAILGLMGLWAGQPVWAAPLSQTAPTLEELRNAQYRSLNTESGFVQLEDGVYADADRALTVTLTDYYATGDLNGDELADAVVALTTESNGETFISLAGLVNQEADLTPAGVVLLGRQVQIGELGIVNGRVLVDYWRQGPYDQACCPTQNTTSQYELRRGLLVPIQARAFGRLFPFQEGGLWGYVNVLGEVVIEPQFALAGEFVEGLAAVSFDGATTGFINQLGELVIEPRFSYAGAFHHGLALAGVPGVDADKPFLTTFIDRDGRFRFGDARYVMAEPFSEGLAAVSLDGERFGYIDLSGQLVIEPQYTQAESFHEGLAPVRFGEQYGFIDRTGQFIVEPQFDSAEPFYGGRAQIGLGDKVGYINHRGDIVIEPIFDSGHNFAEGRALVFLEGRPLYIDEAGNVVIDLPNLTAASNFSEGLAAVAVAGQYGYLDLQGQLVIPPQFSYAGSFANGLAVFETPASWGVINNIGEVVLERPKFAVMAEQTTPLVAYTPAVPDTVRPGRCTANSTLLPLSTAWRCTVDNETFDPCLLGEDGTSVVCAAEPATGGNAFRVELAEPLPEATMLAKPDTTLWQIQTEDGAICTLVNGLNVMIEDQPITHTCSDGAVLLGEVDQSAEPWTVTKATVVNDEAGNYSAEKSQSVGVMTAWQPAAPQE